MLPVSYDSSTILRISFKSPILSIEAIEVASFTTVVDVIFSSFPRWLKELDEVLHVFKSRPLEGEFPYVWLDATFPKVREGGRVRVWRLSLSLV